MSDEFAEINDIKICYEVRGEGDPIILVHGFGSKKEVFIGQIGVFSENYKVVRLDNRGSGKSDRPNEPYSLEMLVDDLRALMDYLKIEQAHLLGYSLGGMIVQNFVLVYPERVKKLILVNTVPKVEVDEATLKEYIDSKISNYEIKMEDPAKAFYEGAEGGYTADFIKFMKEKPKEMIHGIFTAEDLIRDSSIDPTRPQDYMNQAPTLRQHDIVDQLPNIKKKTLIICASNDLVTPKEDSKFMHKQIPDSRLVEIEGGHSTPKEKASEINGFVLDFLKE